MPAFTESTPLPQTHHRTGAAAGKQQQAAAEERRGGMALAPPILGVIIWTIICGAAIVLINVAKIGRYINKDNAGIAVVWTITAGIATYLMWVVTWMHQWHPLLPVIMPAKE